MNKIIRVYPIRTSRKKWKIPLFCYHKCNEEYCNVILANNNNQITILPNPDFIDGKCPLSNKLIPTYIKLSSFDINNPSGCTGELYDYNMKVILDNEFTILIHFPLSYSFEAIIITPTNTGFTLKELIFSIKNVYEFIYEEEERTASSQIYNLKKFCISCGNKNLSEYIEYMDTFMLNNDDCCICFSGYDLNEYKGRTTPFSLAVKLKCGHIFHENCIKKWIDKSGTCPICRYNIYECKVCDGKGIVYYNFTGIVIPIQNRFDILNRNETNGIFGIYGYDLEDLVIENMSYDKNKKRLHLKINV